MPATAYVVAAPRRCDAVSATLRAAYAAVQDDRAPFEDLIAKLDTLQPAKASR